MKSENLKFRKIFYTLAIVAFALISCEKQESVIDSIGMKSNITRTNSVLIEKVKKLENPYSVSNMKKAYAILQKENGLRMLLHIDATHYYVRFLPKDSVEYETLLADTSLTLFSYPLDYELTEGEIYIEPSIGNNHFTWLYTRVPVDYIFSNITYEIIEELYLPTLTEGVLKKLKQQNSAVIDNWEQLEYKSLEMTGNITDSLKQRNSKRKKYTPKATITVYDDTLKCYIPVAGVCVRARKWFNWEKGYTNDQGVAEMSGSFTGNYDWSIEWQDNLWRIRNGYIFDAYYYGSTGKNGTDWYYQINSGKNKVYAHIHRACYRMFYGNNLGAYKQQKWLSNGILGNIFPLNIAVSEGNGHGSAGINYGGNWLLFPQIIIWMNGSTEETFSNPNGTNSLNIKERAYLSHEIYSTTIHELAHSTHILNMDIDIASLAFVEKIIIESWATAVEWAITNDEYRNRGLITYRHFDRRYWSLLKTDYTKNYYSKMEYSPIFIDLIDTHNQKSLGTFYSDYIFPDDKVSGFTLSELRTLLRKTLNLSDLKKNVLTLRNDDTMKANINTLFEVYEKAK